MKKAWQGACVAFFLFSAFALASASAYPMFDPLGPGPGFFPVWLSALGALLALALLVEVTLGRVALPAGDSLVPDGAGTRRVLAILLALVAAAVLLEPLGFRLTMLLFMLALPLALGVRDFLLLAGLALAGSFGVFQVFFYVLRVPLPIGAFGI